MYFLIITLYGTVTLSANLLFHKIRHHSLHLCVCYLQKLVYILKLLTVRPDSPEYHQGKKADPKERHVIKSGRQLFSVAQYGRKLNVSVFVTPFYRILPPFDHYCRQFCVVISMKKIILSKIFSKYLMKLIFRKRLEGQLIQ